MIVTRTLKLQPDADHPYTAERSLRQPVDRATYDRERGNNSSNYWDLFGFDWKGGSVSARADDGTEVLLRHERHTPDGGSVRSPVDASPPDLLATYQLRASIDDDHQVLCDAEIEATLLADERDFESLALYDSHDPFAFFRGLFVGLTLCTPLYGLILWWIF